MPVKWWEKAKGRKRRRSRKSQLSKKIPHFSPDDLNGKYP